MAYIPYSTQTIEDEDVEAVTAALRAPFLTQGPRIAAFESAFAERHRAGEAVAVSNATAALHIGCMALDVGPGDVLWTSPNSFVASANCARYCGADVDFVDIDPRTRNISIAELARKLSTARERGRLPKVVVPVDFAGFPVDMQELRDLAHQYGFRILADASHATGATYRGAPVGSALADATVFSFHAVKVVTSGEGGMLTTHDPDLAERFRMLRSHGITRDTQKMAGPSEGAWYYEQLELGYNYRITDLQAALGLSQLGRLEAMHAQRVRLADRYDSLLADLPLALPCRGNDRISAWHLYVVEVEGGAAVRRKVFDAMRAAEIGVNVHYFPIHLQPYYRGLGFKAGDFPAAEAYYGAAISLPLFPNMTEEQQDFVAATLRAALGRGEQR